MSPDDLTALEFYRDPVNQVPAGPARRRKAPRKTSMISVRFDPEFIDSLRAIAEAEGITVSTWIRRAAQQARERYAREHRPQGLIAGSERKGETRALPSSHRPWWQTSQVTTSMATAGGSARCEHMSAYGVSAFACGTCGPLTIREAA